MIDNIKLSLPRCRDMPDISGYLDNGNENCSMKTGEVSVYGNVHNTLVVTLSKAVYLNSYMETMCAN